MNIFTRYKMDGYLHLNQQNSTYKKTNITVYLQM